jgi:2-dehydropantoate 2-reductase
MREHGLTVEGGPDEIHLPKVNAVENPAAIGVVDLVMFAVKLWDTDAAIEQIRPIVGRDTIVISFQNGVLKDEYLTRAFGPARIMGGVCYVATSIARPGIIRRTGPLERMVFGEFDGDPTPRAVRFLDACLRGGIKAELSRDIRRDIWEKFVFLVALSGATTTMRTTIGAIRANAQTRAFLLDVMREVVAVGRARGIDLPADYAERQLKLADDLAPDMTSSMHHDLERGNKLEIRWLSGGVVELGRAAGIATPLNRAIADILTLRADGMNADERTSRRAAAPDGAFRP